MPLATQSKSQKSKVTHAELMSTDYIPAGGRLPIHQLPEVQKNYRQEFKKASPKLRSRIGNVALDAAVVTSWVATHPVTFGRDLKAANREYWGKPAEPETRIAKRRNRAASFIGRITERMVDVRMNERDQRKAARKVLTQEKWQQAQQDYREAHPEVDAHEKALQKAKFAMEQAGARASWSSMPKSRASFAQERFANRNGSSFSHAIPRLDSKNRDGTKFDNNYMALAERSLADAIFHKSDAGTIPLWGREILSQRLASKEANGMDLVTAANSEATYVDGVSTALWKLGFVNFENDKAISSGGGTVNEDIVWGKTVENAQTAELTFDPDNELHRMLMPDTTTFSNPVLRIEMNPASERMNQYMNLSVTEASALQAAA